MQSYCTWSPIYNPVNLHFNLEIMKDCKSVHLVLAGKAGTFFCSNWDVKLVQMLPYPFVSEKAVACNQNIF